MTAATPRPLPAGDGRLSKLLTPPLPCTPCTAGPGRWQLLICLYAALYLVADAAEAMVMTYLSPAVRGDC